MMLTESLRSFISALFLVSLLNVSTTEGEISKTLVTERVVLDKVSWDLEALPYLTVSPDNTRLAFVASSGGIPINFMTPDGPKSFPSPPSSWWVVLDGNPGKKYTSIDKGTITFSPDGKRLAYVAGISYHRYAVVDEKIGEPYGVVAGICFSKDGKRFAYSALSRGKQFIVLDEQAGKEYLGVSSPTFSPDGKQIAYAAKDAAGSFVVVGESEGKRRYDGIIALPVFSADFKHVAYGSRIHEGGFIVIDDKEQEVFDGVACPVFSPDGKRLAYVAQKGDKKFVVVDGKPGNEFKDIFWPGPCFDSTSEHIAYSASDGKTEFVVTDEVRGKGYYAVGKPVYSPNGTILAYVAETPAESIPGQNATEQAIRNFQRRGQCLVVNGQEGPHYNTILCDPVYSQDGRHIAYAATNGEGEFIVLDGVEGRHYEHILCIGGGWDIKIQRNVAFEMVDLLFRFKNGRPVFTDNGTLRYLAHMTGSIILVEHKLSQSPQGNAMNKPETD